MLFFSDINLESYRPILKEYSLTDYMKKLLSLLRNFKDYNSLNLTPKEFKFKKEKILNSLRKL